MQPGGPPGGPPGGLLAGPPQPAAPPGMGSPQGMAAMGQPQQFDGSQFFMDAAAGLMMTDPALSDNIKGRARSLDMQSKQMMKLMKIAQAMGEDVSSLGPIADQLLQQRDKVFKELVGRANVPTSASKPARPKVNRPRM